MPTLPAEQMATIVGEERLESLVAAPAGAGSTWFVLAHPHPLHGGTMDNKVVFVLARELQRHGQGTIRFNFRGVGGSSGRFGDGDGELRDLAAAVEHAQTLGGERVFVVGYSFGAAMTARLAPSLSAPDKHPLVLVAPPLEMWSLEELLGYGGDVHLVCGTRDEFCREATLRAFTERLGQRAQARVVEGADHFFVGTTTRLWRLLEPVLLDDEPS